MWWKKQKKKKCLAFVLGGGGSRGALQVGALRALLEAGITPDLMVGTSIGAVNAVGLAVWGVNTDGLDALENAWEEMSHMQLLDPRIPQLVLRALIRRPSNHAQRKVKEYFIAKGLDEELRFSQISGVRLGLISADIESGQPVIFGQNPNDLVLEGLLASVALFPWFQPYQKDTHLMIDGGALSNLAIEPALCMGATEIIAFDLDERPEAPPHDLSLPHVLEKYGYAQHRRQIYLETALAEAKGVPVRLIDFSGLAQGSILDFSNCQPLVKAGYNKTIRVMAGWDWLPQSSRRP